MSRDADLEPSRVLIYRQGSLGDTLVALPCFHLIERSYPSAERRLLTNIPITRHVAPSVELLRNAGLVSGTIEYPVLTRDPQELRQVVARIRAWRPDVLIYLVQARSRGQMTRDWLFFRLCGIRRIIGLSLWGDLAKNRPVRGQGLWESEANRLARSLRSLGDAELSNDASWNLRLSDAERASAASAIEPLASCNGFAAFSLGTKWQPNDYGDENWQAVLRQLGRAFPKLGLALLGAANETDRSEHLASAWPGVCINLCGRLTPRESGAVLEQARFFMGHDSGPMHLAATVGTRCVAVFSGRGLPGVWFPRGSGHRVLYRNVSCRGCGLSECVAEEKRCIRSITTTEIFAACREILDQFDVVDCQPWGLATGMEKIASSPL